MFPITLHAIYPTAGIRTKLGTTDHVALWLQLSVDHHRCAILQRDSNGSSLRIRRVLWPADHAFRRWANWLPIDVESSLAGTLCNERIVLRIRTECQSSYFPEGSTGLPTIDHGEPPLAARCDKGMAFSVGAEHRWRRKGKTR